PLMGGLYRAGAAARDGITEGKSLLCAHVLLRLNVGERASKLWRDYHEEVNHSDGVRGPVLFRPDESRHGRGECSWKGEGREGRASDVARRTDQAGTQRGASSYREGRRRAGVWRGWHAQGRQAGDQRLYLHPDGDESP